MVDVSLVTIAPRILAAAHRPVPMGQVQRFLPALDKVWAFLKTQPGLREDGHNVFLYRHPTKPGEPMGVDFGVEITRRFEAESGITCVDTPAGLAARAMHIGPYSGMFATHQAIHRWCAANGHKIGGWSLEIYGDWNADESKLETEILYLLA